MKISVCITVYNEEDNILSLLTALTSQTKKPDEIVVTDGGSTDNTVKIIQDYQQKNNRINLIVAKKRINIARGRNLAIKKAKYDIIALTDAGCAPKQNWLENITKPFKKDVDVVAGFYEVRKANKLSYIAALFLGVHPRNFNEQFIPSARSVAFRKSVWSEVGGFDETLTLAGEDTEFFALVIKNGVKLSRRPAALVIWSELANITMYKLAQKFYSYARGDAETGIWWHPTKKFFTHNFKVLTIFARYTIFALLALSTVLGFIKPIYLATYVLFYMYFISFKFYKRLPWELWYLESVFYIYLVQSVSDLSVMAGFLAGVKNNFLKKS